MVGRRIVAHRLGQPPLLLQPVVALLFQFADGMGRKELARHAALGQLEGDGLGAILAELERARMSRIGPGAAGAVEAVRLVHRQQRLGAFQRDALLAQRSRGGLQRAPAAGGRIVRGEDGWAVRASIRAVGWRGGDGRLVAHNRPLNRSSSALAPQVGSGEVDDLVDPAAHHGFDHVERKALRHLRGDRRAASPARCG